MRFVSYFGQRFGKVQHYNGALLIHILLLNSLKYIDFK